APAAAAALAQCHELVGQKDKARDLYRSALATAGNDAAVLRAAAGFYLRAGQVPQAQEVLLRLTRHADRAAAAWARRTRAVLLAAEGDPAKAREALALLGGPDGGAAADPGEAVEDQRTRAKLLALQNSGSSRRAAANLLDGLIDRKVATPEDHLLAAQLHEAVGDWPRARQRYLGLLALPGGADPNAVVTAARSLLRHGEADGA